VLTLCTSKTKRQIEIKIIAGVKNILLIVILRQENCYREEHIVDVYRHWNTSVILTFYIKSLINVVWDSKTVCFYEDYKEMQYYYFTRHRTSRSIVFRRYWVRFLAIANGYPDWGFLWISSIPPGEYRDSTLNLGHDRFLRNPFQFIVIHLSYHRRYTV
jgi:hypothetical protein